MSNAPKKTMRAVVLAAGLLISACGSDSATSDGLPAGADAVAEEALAGPSLITTGSSDLGDILVGSAGITLYGFTNDSKGTSTCDGGCAEAWPPVLATSAELPDGLNESVFSVIERADGSFQLQAGDWPLYFYAGDSAAGDTKGQGSGGVWFVIDPSGGLIK